MKRIMQRVGIVVAVLAVVIGIGVYFLTYDPDRPTGEQLAAVPTVTDAHGTTYGVVLNEEGTTYVVVTDKDQNRYMAEYDGVTAGSTVAQINNDVKAEDLPSNYTGPDVSVSQNISDYMGDVVQNTTNGGSQVTPSGGTTTAVAGTTVAATTVSGATKGTTAPGGATTVPTTVNGAQQPGTTTSATAPSGGSTVTTQPSATQAYRIKKYEEIFKSGTYVMTVTMNDPDYPEPVTMALKNGNMYVETAMSMEEGRAPLKLKMLYLKNEDVMYLLIDDLKKYCKLPEDMVAEFDMSSMVSDFKINTVGEIKTSTANINGKTLAVESYVNESGETVNYYFDGDSIVRFDTISKNGTTDSVYYSMFSTDVPDSYFQIPADYGYWNLSWIGALM